MKSDVFNQYVDRVTDLFNIDRETLFSKLKQRHIVDARQLLYYLCYNRQMKLIIIQKFMMNNGYKIAHNSVINGIRVIQEKIKEDKDYQSIIKDIEKAVSELRDSQMEQMKNLNEALKEIGLAIKATKEGDSNVTKGDTIKDALKSNLEGIKTLKENSSDYMARAKELFEKQASYQARQEFYKQQMELKDKLWTKEIYQDILRIAGEVAKEKGLDLVFREDEIDFSETNANELGLAMRVQKLLYSGGCLDITEEVTARLDAEK
jgi:Skp family chaperone for outer membrane proteins